MSDFYGGGLFAAITKVNDIDGQTYRVIVQATYETQGEWAIEAIKRCDLREAASQQPSAIAAGGKP